MMLPERPLTKRIHPELTADRNNATPLLRTSHQRAEPKNTPATSKLALK